MVNLLQSLLREKFFNACSYHEEVRKNEKNIFCLDCCRSICPHCLTPHASHRLLQIRRYVYHDVIRLSDAEKLMDCGFVQSYTTNSAKVVFLNQRPQNRACRGSANNCNTCDRSLQHPYLYCSLYCKLQDIVRSEGEGGVSKYIYKGENISLGDEGGGLMTPDSVLEQSSESWSSGSAGFMSSPPPLASTATTHEVAVVRKKRTSYTTTTTTTTSRPRPISSSTITVSMMNRRKGSRPQRSPLY